MFQILFLKTFFLFKINIYNWQNIIIFDVLYTVLNIILNILDWFFGWPIFDKKEVKEIKKSPFYGDFG